MKFSVLINNYNYGRFLAEAVSSVAAQSLPAHEIIVVDDGSTDDSVAVLESLRAAHPGLRILAQPNGGQLSALRAGIRHATGDWCVFLDADDTWTPDHLAGLEGVATKHPDVGSIFCGHRETKGPPVYRIPWPRGRVGPSIALVAAFRIRIGTLTSAIALRRDFALAAVDLDPAFDADWRIRADDCLVYGASLHGAIAYHQPVVTVNYRIHDANAFAQRDRTVEQYRDRYRLARLCAAYAARVGIYERDLPFHLARELTLKDNAHRYTRGRYRRAISRLNIGWSAKLVLVWKTFRSR